MAPGATLARRGCAKKLAVADRKGRRAAYRAVVGHQRAVKGLVVGPYGLEAQTVAAVDDIWRIVHVDVRAAIRAFRDGKVAAGGERAVRRDQSSVDAVLQRIVAKIGPREEEASVGGGDGRLRLRSEGNREEPLGVEDGGGGAARGEARAANPRRIGAEEREHGPREEVGRSAARYRRVRVFDGARSDHAGDRQVAAQRERLGSKKSAPASVPDTKPTV